MTAKANFDAMDVVEQALFIIDNYADIFLDNLGLGLNRRRILSIMYEARTRLMQEWRFPELVKVLTFLQETFHQDLQVEIDAFRSLMPLSREEVGNVIALRADQYFEMGNYRAALVHYQLLEAVAKGGFPSERAQECLARIDGA
jgi:hypothetical protein